MSEDFQPIIVRRARKQKHGHHGGAWKVAYADFVTAMMAFFLVMWIIGAGTREQRAAVSEYFKNPSNTPGTATMAPPGKIGPGGASDSAIQLGGAMDIPRGPGKDKRGAPSSRKDIKDAEKLAHEQDKAPLDAKDADKLAHEQEKARLEELMKQLHAAIQSSQALVPFKDQLLLDITPEGLRIQIVDKLNRPMFDLGSATLKPYTAKILRELGQFINSVPNKISISGHTDDAPYTSDHDYSNWELSADRGNAARRALIAGGLEEDKVARVVGLAAAVPFDKLHPGDPINRRISIIVMTRQAEQAARAQETAANAPGAGAMPSAPASAPSTDRKMVQTPLPPLPPLPAAIRPAANALVRSAAPSAPPAAQKPASP
ncbi:MAG: flagellar motor protein MotB [Rhodanobacter sp.]|jgi:chemotaxis protein MotB|nr:flagellar motor protein MotB [Rhodanobacter sp.]